MHELEEDISYLGWDKRRGRFGDLFLLFCAGVVEFYDGRAGGRPEVQLE